MKNLTHFFLLAILFSTISCKKDKGPDNPYGLPDATQTGENTFGCLINGEPWVADATQYLGLEKDVSAIYDEVGVGAADQYYLNMDARFFVSSEDSARTEILSFNLRPIYEEGIINFSDLLRADFIYRKSLVNISNSMKVYGLDTLYNNKVNITHLDTISNTFSGVFDLRLLRSFEIEIDTLYISEGRFDVKYQPD